MYLPIPRSFSDEHKVMKSIFAEQFGTLQQTVNEGMNPMVLKTARDDSLGAPLCPISNTHDDNPFLKVLDNSLAVIKRRSVDQDTINGMGTHQRDKDLRCSARSRTQTEPLGGLGWDRSITLPDTPESDKMCAASCRSMSSSSESSSSSVDSTTLTFLPEHSRQRARTVGKENVLSPCTSRRSSASSLSMAQPPPIRYLPQGQAVITTGDNWHITATNKAARPVLLGSDGEGELVGKPMLNFVDPSVRSLMFERIVQYHEQKFSSDATANFLVFGDVLPIIKQDGSKSAASLWLREKRDLSGQVNYVWTLEEIVESQVKAKIDHKGVLCAIDENVRELYGYQPSDVIGQKLDILLPSFSLQQNQPDTQSCYSSRTMSGAYFPSIVKMLSVDEDGSRSLRITSIPFLSGLLTVSQDGLLKECDLSFAKHVFGYPPNQLLTGYKPIGDLLPQFPDLLRSLQQDDLLQTDYVLDSLTCRQLLDSNIPQSPELTKQQRRLTLTPNGRELPVFFATPWDGFQLEVQVQLKLLPSDDIALWVSFDREVAFARFGHTTGSRKSLAACAQPHQATTSNAIAHRTHSSPTGETMIPHPGAQAPLPYQVPTLGEYSAQTRRTCIDDYEIISELGKGSYGVVNLAYLKSDETKCKVVIKNVIKSRILVDCWTRDRKLGIVPVEIHILHTLRKFPHPNCSDMMDYFEDDDHYYIVMALYGESIDLFEYIEVKPSLSEDDIRLIFRQVSLGVQHLHNNNIVHRDIKDENVILDETGAARLIDFGSAAYLRNDSKFEKFVGTLDYAAPEVLKGQTYNGKPQDIWALGILLYTLLYRENPFYNVEEIMSRELRTPFMPSEGLLDLITKMLDRDVENRVTIHDILVHPWLN